MSLIPSLSKSTTLIDVAPSPAAALYKSEELFDFQYSSYLPVSSSKENIFI